MNKTYAFSTTRPGTQNFMASVVDKTAQLAYSVQLVMETEQGRTCKITVDFEKKTAKLSSRWFKLKSLHFSEVRYQE